MAHITIEREEVELALDWFKCYADGSMSRNNAEALADEVVEALKERLAQPAQPEQEPVAIPDEVRKVAQAMQKDGYRGPLAWASKVIDFVADYTPPQRTEQEPVAWAKFLHYPECWDTAAYPTLHDAIHEALAWSGCSVCTPPARPAQRTEQEPLVPKDFEALVKQDIAIWEANCNAESDAYFKARPQFDNTENRRSFEAGYRRGWLSYSPAHGIMNADAL